MISEQEYTTAAQKLNCEEAAIKSVTHTEAAGEGFYKSGKIILKFEGHVFHEFTQGRYDESHPTISYPAWTEKYSQFGDAAYIRFDQAFTLDPHAAMMATSWGMFQIMGENYSSCGFATIDAFVTGLKLGEDNQLDAFCTYCKTQGLDKYLREFATELAIATALFAEHYNGSRYKVNHYDTDLAKYYLSFKTPAV
jgi:hypothetical protein